MGGNRNHFDVDHPVNKDYSYNVGGGNQCKILNQNKHGIVGLFHLRKPIIK